MSIYNNNNYSTISYDDVPSYESFDDMGLSDDLLRGIYAYGFEKPSAIQQKAIKAAQAANATKATFALT